MKYVTRARAKKNSCRAILKSRREKVRRVLKALARKRPRQFERRIIPPAVFSFSENYFDTVRCLQELKDAVLIRDENHERRRTFLDFEPIKKISIAGALVLAAEIDRWRKIKNIKLNPRNVAEWDPAVKRVLSDLGFFELLDVTIKIEDDIYGPDQHITVIPFVSSASVDGELFSKISSYMTEIARVFRQDPSIYAALTEAAYNSTLHAYPEGHQFKYPIHGKRWWATCSFDPKSNCVKFLVYDQGVGISETLPRWKHWEKVRGKLSEVPLVGGSVGAMLNDSSRAIEAAIDVSRTSLSGGHGKGLKDVVSPVAHIEGAQVRLLSGKGTILYSKGGVTQRRDEALHIGGTLIEWTIPAGTTPKEVELT